MFCLSSCYIQCNKELRETNKQTNSLTDIIAESNGWPPRPTAPLPSTVPYSTLFNYETIQFPISFFFFKLKNDLSLRPLNIFFK